MERYWATRLDKFLELSGRDILQDAGKMSAEIAKEHAESEFEKYRIIQDRLFESDFDEELKNIEKRVRKQMKRWFKFFFNWDIPSLKRLSKGIINKSPIITLYQDNWDQSMNPFSNTNYSLLGKNSLIKCLLDFSFHRDIFVNNASILLNYFFLADYRCGQRGPWFILKMENTNNGSNSQQPLRRNSKVLNL